MQSPPPGTERDRVTTGRRHDDPRVQTVRPLGGTCEVGCLVTTAQRPETARDTVSAACLGVASRRPGPFPGLFAVAALLVDYVLTVSGSVAGGVFAITTALSEVDGVKVVVGVVCIVLLTIGNLRGIREAGVVFAGPT